MFDIDNIDNRQKELDLYNIYKLLVVGVGGIGSWVSLFASLCLQVKNLHLWDDDIVEDTNLNRTPFRLCDIGYNKVDAMEAIINERRLGNSDLNVYTYNERFTDDTCLNFQHSTNSILIDCRDGLYGDIKSFKGQVYKVSYDGFSITIDGDYKNRVIWGQRQGGYEMIPSFVCPAVLVANLVIADICQNNIENRLNKMITFDSSNLLEYIEKQTENSVDGEIKKDIENEEEEIENAIDMIGIEEDEENIEDEEGNIINVTSTVYSTST